MSEAAEVVDERHGTAHLADLSRTVPVGVRRGAAFFLECNADATGVGAVAGSAARGIHA